MIFILVINNEELTKLQNRDPEVLEKIYKNYKNKIFSFLLIKTNGDKDIANDVLSETFCQIIKSSAKLKNTKNIQAWIFTITKRRLADYFRKEARNKRELKEAAMDDFIQQDNMSENLEEKQKLLLINMALDQLKERHKNILKLKYIENKTQKQIANELNKSMAMVNSLITRAKKAFEKAFKNILRDF